MRTHSPAVVRATVPSAACAAALGCILATPPAHGQTAQQKITPPVAVYWMSAETRGGIAGLPGGGAAGLFGGLVGGALGGPGGGAGLQGGRSLLLQLGSARTAAGEPQAEHAIPAGMNMGPSLPLLTPRQPPREPREPSEAPEDFQKPKGRMLIYWGCGDATRSGQPIVIDFAKIAAGQVPNFPGVRISAPRGPSFGSSRTYGEWPNAETRTAVPNDASLRGEHVVKGSYSPEIRFSVPERTDFMAAPAFQPVQRTAAGGLSVQWQAIANATGYALTAMGQNTSTQDLIVWSSSEQADMGWALNTWLPPSEVARLIKARMVLAPSTTECTVPPEVVRQAGTAMLTFVGYGDELDVVHPPRPADPRQAWAQLYAVKVRQRTGAMLMLAEGEAGAGIGQAPAGAGQDTGAPAQTQRPAAAPTVQDVIKEGVGGVLRGLFGR